VKVPDGWRPILAESCHCGKATAPQSRLCYNHAVQERLAERNRAIIADRKAGIPFRELELKYEITRSRMHEIIKRGS
jgi:hypothetical protein